jgi:hypothetical protein
MRSARRGWWVPAILFASACGGPGAVKAVAGGSTGSSASTSGGGGAGTGTTVGTGGVGAGGDGTGGGVDHCTMTFQAPLDVCDTNCLVQLTKGGTPTILYESPPPAGYSVEAPVAVTDDYVIVTAFWGATARTDPAAVFGLVEIPRAGGPPVLVDTFGANGADTSGVWFSATDGGDGYLYYGATPNTGGPPQPLVLRRVSTTTLGEQATPLGAVPSSVLFFSLVVDGGYLYVATKSGIVRIPTGGGAVENILGQGPDAFGPGGIAVNGGWVYDVPGPGEGNVVDVQRVPVGGGMPSTVAVLPGAGPWPLWWGLVAFGGAPASLFVAQQTQVLRFDANETMPHPILAANGTFSTMTFVGSRLYVLDTCPFITGGEAPHPSGSFERSYDTVTGATGYLEEEPGYPFVPGPTGFAHDAAGDTLYYALFSQG